MQGEESLATITAYPNLSSYLPFRPVFSGRFRLPSHPTAWLRPAHRLRLRLRAKSGQSQEDRVSHRSIRQTADDLKLTPIMSRKSVVFLSARLSFVLALGIFLLVYDHHHGCQPPDSDATRENGKRLTEAVLFAAFFGDTTSLSEFA